jgi:hypothetical protein
VRCPSAPARPSPHQCPAPLVMFQNVRPPEETARSPRR